MCTFYVLLNSIYMHAMVYDLKVDAENLVAILLHLKIVVWKIELYSFL